MLQILIWGIGLVLIGMGFTLLYMTKAFPVREVVTRYRCELCTRITKDNTYQCECGGNFRPVREADIADPQPTLYMIVSFLMMLAGPIIIWMGNVQAASVSDLLY